MAYSDIAHSFSYISLTGNIKDLDTKYLSTVGPVQQVSLEEIFGY